MSVPERYPFRVRDGLLRFACPLMEALVNGREYDNVSATLTNREWQQVVLSSIHEAVETFNPDQLRAILSMDNKALEFMRELGARGECPSEVAKDVLARLRWGILSQLQSVAIPPLNVYLEAAQNNATMLSEIKEYMYNNVSLLNKTFRL